MGVIGSKIVNMRAMTKKEMKAEDWDGPPCIALELDNGSILYPSRDEEGNGPGAMFGTGKDGSFGLIPSA